MTETESIRNPENAEEWTDQTVVQAMPAWVIKKL